MQLQRVLATLLLTFSFTKAVAGEGYIFRRESSSPSSAVTSPYPNAEPVSTTFGILSSSPSSHLGTTSKQTASSTTNHHATPTSAVSTTDGATATVVPGSKQTNSLPLKPVITPALGIAGVLLIGAGLALNLIGIKHKAVHVFLSSMLLASLSVSVLIIYLMSPPVSDAIQGGFFVAALVTGLFFGGISLIFSDITEGLGCLLGGFCLAMWFLILASGGLIKTTTGKAVLIAIFCVAAWSLGFSRYTRNHALIASTSLGGATATVIGIDCFSRAGLVQFWLYLWNLNNKLFPLGTTTYPVTRGIRVETAAIVLLFLLGLMAQLKIWKIVKKRRERSTMDRLRDLESRDEHDTAVGRTVEARNERELRQWEVQYGDKERAMTTVDSALGSSIASLQKRSASVTDGEFETIELDDMSGEYWSSKQAKQTPSTSKAADTDWSQEHPRRSSQQTVVIPEERQDRKSKASVDLSAPTEPDIPVALPQEEDSGQSHIPPIPEVVPLPFSLPIDQDEDAKSDQGSVGTAKKSMGERRGMQMRLSSLKKHASVQESNIPYFEPDRTSSIAALADDESDGGSTIMGDRRSLAQSPFEPDRNSSIAATVDYESDSESDDGTILPDRRSPIQSPFDPPPGHGELTPTRSEAASRLSSYTETGVTEVTVDESDDEVLVRPSHGVSQVSPKSPKVGDPFSKPPRPQFRRGRGKSIESDQSSGDETTAETVKPAVHAVTGSLRGHLPDKLSKVALVYRTNEWAKHIADADQPQDEDLPESNSPGTQIDRAFAEEAARPVDPAGLVGYTNGITEKPEAPPHKVAAGNTNPYRRSQEDPGISWRTSPSVIIPASTPMVAPQRSVSQMSVQRQNSNTSVVPPVSVPRIQRMHSQNIRSPPLLVQEPLVESPVEDDAASSVPARQLPTSFRSSGSLNSDPGRTSSQIQRPTNGYLPNGPTRTPSVNVIAPGDSGSVHRVQLQRATVDNTPVYGVTQAHREQDMTLSERRSFVQQRRQSLTAAGPPLQPPAPTASPPPLGNYRTSQGQPTYPFLPAAAPAHLQMNPSHNGLISASPVKPQGNIATAAPQIYDSHQPLRTNAADPNRQAALLAQWRASLADMKNSAAPISTGEENAQLNMETQARQSMMAQKQWAAWNRQQTAEEKSKRQSQMEQAMRSGQMQGAHQDVMRRMQAQANHNASRGEQ